MSMDKTIEKKRFTPQKMVGIAALIIVVGAIAWTVQDSASRDTFRVDRERISIATVTSGEFEDFIPVRGRVTPLKTVFLDSVEGGRVEALLVEEGTFVTAGQPLLELSNTSLQLDVMSREAEVSEQLNNLRNTRLAVEQNRLSLKSDLVDIDYNLKRLKRTVDRRRELFERELISLQQLQEAEDEYEYNANRREITIESQRQDELLREAQIDQLESSVSQLESNLLIARKNLDNLTIRSPIEGLLSSLNAEIGESKSRGERLGQVDVIDQFKITASVDEFYVTRVEKGLAALFTLQGVDYELITTKVYPEIRGGQFRLDLAFASTPPTEIRRGQTVQLRLQLGASGEALLLDRGGFFQESGGNWAFVLEKDGTYAERKDIRLGRRNPNYFEVLDGLEAGQQVIVSDYTAFADMDRITFKD
jgi:HlyD family secretion protein